MEIFGAQFRSEGMMWLGDLCSDFGHLEVMLDGTPEAPSPKHVEAYRKFSINLMVNLRKVRRQLRLPFLYRPFRIAPNIENRVGVQFKNKITGKQVQMLFWD